MYYFFDESGSWSYLNGNSKIRTNLGGLFINEENFNKVFIEVDQFKRLNSKISLHASEMSNELKENLYTLIANLFDKNLIKASVKPFTERYLINQFERFGNSDELYMEEASSFILRFIIGDSNPRIFWDQAFRKAYIAAIIDHIQRQDRWDPKLKKLSKKYEFNSSYIDEYSEELVKKLNKVDYPSPSIIRFKDLLLKSEDQTQIIKKFDFSELDLYLTKEISLRTMFNKKIEDKLYDFTNDFNLPHIRNRISVEYLGKHYSCKEIIGIELIDAICNLFYSCNSKCPDNASSSVLSIFSNTDLVEE